MKHVLVVPMLLGLLSTGVVMAQPADAAERTARIVSTSGVLHADVADYRRAKWWKPGMPRGINASWRTAIDAVIGQVASEQPDAVLHTGDMVEGRWGIDDDVVGVFGAVDTFLHKKRGVRRAANLYYAQAREHWARHGLAPYYAIGDHEVGDVGRSGEIRTDDFRYRGRRRGGTPGRSTSRTTARPLRGSHRRGSNATPRTRPCSQATSAWSPSTRSPGGTTAPTSASAGCSCVGSTRR